MKISHTAICSIYLLLFTAMISLLVIMDHAITPFEFIVLSVVFILTFTSLMILVLWVE